MWTMCSGYQHHEKLLQRHVNGEGEKRNGFTPQGQMKKSVHETGGIEWVNVSKLCDLDFAADDDVALLHDSYRMDMQALVSELV